MVEPEKLEIICKKVSESYKKVYGDRIRRIFLYGSYARGDADDESDIDFVAIVDEERLSMQRELKRVIYITNDIDLEYDVLTSPTAIPLLEFEKYKEHLPYYKNIVKDGIRIG